MSVTLRLLAIFAMLIDAAGLRLRDAASMPAQRAARVIVARAHAAARRAHTRERQRAGHDYASHDDAFDADSLFAAMTYADV